MLDKSWKEIIARKKICSLSELVVYSIKSAGLKLSNWKNPIAPKSLTMIGYQSEIFNVEWPLLHVTKSDNKAILTF